MHMSATRGMGVSHSRGTHVGHDGNDFTRARGTHVWHVSCIYII